MWNFIGKTIAGMVLTKEARQAAGGLAQTAMRHASEKAVKALLPSGALPAPAAAPALPAPLPFHTEPVPPAVPAPTAAPQQPQSFIPGVPALSANPSRAELIRHALRVRRAQQSLLADLSDEDREKLVAIATKAFMAESKSHG